MWRRGTTVRHNGTRIGVAMAEAASAQQAASATAEDTSQQRAGRRRRTSTEPQRAQHGATAAAAPGALDTLIRLQQLADASPQAAQLRRLQALVDASPQVAQLQRLQALADASPQAVQLRRLQALADNHYAPVAQLAGDPEEEGLVQGQFASAELQPQLQQAPRANNTGLPDQLKSGIESLSGLSMDHVRVHYNSAQPAQLNALAYAQGNDIHLGPGQEQHLPHEAWHVVQQRQGRVQATMQMAGVGVNDDVGLEREADVMGGRAQGGAVKFVAGGGQLANRAVATVETHAAQTVPVRELRVVQRLTKITYNSPSVRLKTDSIVAMNHSRVPHNDTHRSLAASLSGYGFIQAPGNCNHYVPYASVARAVEVAISTPQQADLDNAVAWLTSLVLPGADTFMITPLNHYHYGVRTGQIPAVNIQAAGQNHYNEEDINNEVDDLIYNLANDPRNLFYWPSSTGDGGGTQVDTPQGLGPINCIDVITRLQNYRQSLTDLGFNVV